MLTQFPDISAKELLVELLWLASSLLRFLQIIGHRWRWLASTSRGNLGSGMLPLAMVIPLAFPVFFTSLSLLSPAFSFDRTGSPVAFMCIFKFLSQVRHAMVATQATQTTHAN